MRGAAAGASRFEADVARVDFGGVVLRLDDGTALDATVRGRMRGQRKALGNAVVVGDRVAVAIEHGRAVVGSVAPRRNAFSRRAAGDRPLEQVVAANLDQVALVASLVQPPFREGLADRVLGQSAHAGIPGRLVVTKLDLGPRAEAEAVRDAYEGAGIPAHLVCAPTGEGLDQLRAACRGHRTLFVGHSGVGKSTLLNALSPDLGLAAAEVNERTGKGRHTTTAAWLLVTADGLEVIDTPGVRAFGLWGVGAADLDRVYPEFRPYLGRCRFGDCRHGSEPGCAVREAVAAGAVAARRHASYLALRAELEEQEARARA